MARTRGAPDRSRWRAHVATLVGTGTTRTIWWITLASLVVRLVYHVINQQDWALYGDSWTYHNVARLAADGNGFVNPIDWGFAHELVQAAEHPPLWALVLTVATKLGITSATSQILINIVLGAATVNLVGRLALLLGGARLAVLAASIAAIYPNLFAWNAELLSESLSVFLVTLTVLLAYRVRLEPSTRSVVTASAAAAFAALARSEGILLIPLLILPMVWSQARHDRDRLLRMVALSVGTATVIVGPIVAWNMSRFEEPTFITNQFGRGLASGACDRAFHGSFSGFWSLDCLSEVKQESVRQGWDESQTDKAFREYALEYYGDHAGELPRVVAQRIGRMFHLYRPDHQMLADQLAESRPWWIAGSGLMTYYLLAVLAVPGAILLHRKALPIWPILLPIAFCALGAAIVFGTTRYRASSEGMLVILGAAGLDGTVLAAARRRLSDRGPRWNAAALGIGIGVGLMVLTGALGMYVLDAADKIAKAPTREQIRNRLPEQVDLPD